MLRSASELHGYRVEARDGRAGKINDLLFDDAEWVIRYLVVDTGKWLPGRLVLVSPVALGDPDWTQRVLTVDLTKEQIENSPGISADEPVSRQRETDVVDYFGWPTYWAPPVLPAGSGSVSPVPPMALRPGADASDKGDSGADGDPHLRSLHEVAGYHIRAADDDVGHVEDLVLDDGPWAVRYVVVDTRNWLPGRKVILAPGWFTRIDWRDSRAVTILDRQSIENAPPYDPERPLDRDYENLLHNHYDRPPYWTEVVSRNMMWKA